ncbi:MAG: DNA-binding protein WhiA [Clostridiales bacterium]|nr:DNA-binding protein WhiA [Clostridiales bacterium]
MTFSQSVKNEILKSVRNLKGCCATSFLTAVLKSTGSLTLGSGGFSFTIGSDNHDFLAICQALASSELGVPSQLVEDGVNKKGAPLYACVFDKSLGEKLSLVTKDRDGAMVFGEMGYIFPEKPCCRRAFMQGLFVAGGSVVIPQDDDLQNVSVDKAKYHLELRLTDNEFADSVIKEFSELKLRVMQRKNHIVLYLKDSESVADFLVYVNAMSAKLKLENVIAARSIRNDANRQRNCTIANIEKAVAAAVKQIDAINLIKQKGLFDALPDTLKDIANLRLRHPDSNLDEMAEMLGISKSGANHRFTKLIELAQKIQPS